MAIGASSADRNRITRSQVRVEQGLVSSNNRGRRMSSRGIGDGSSQVASHTSLPMDVLISLDLKNFRFVKGSHFRPMARFVQPKHLEPSSEVIVSLEPVAV